MGEMGRGGYERRQKSGTERSGGKEYGGNEEGEGRGCPNLFLLAEQFLSSPMPVRENIFLLEMIEDGVGGERLTLLNIQFAEYSTC